MCVKKFYEKNILLLCLGSFASRLGRLVCRHLKVHGENENEEKAYF